MPSPAVQRLRDIAKNVPVLNEQARQRQLAAQQMQTQQAVQQSAPGKVVQQAQALAPAVQDAANETNAQAMQQTAQQTLAAGQAAVQQQGVEAEQQLASAAQAQQVSLQGQQLQQQGQQQTAEIAQRKEMSAQEMATAKQLQKYGIEMDSKASFLSRKEREGLGALGQDIKSQLLDSRMAFEKDERGRAFTNNRQLADYAIASAQNQQQLNDRLTEMEHAANRDLSMMEYASKVLTTRINQELQSTEKEKDNALAMQLQTQKYNLDREIARKKKIAADKGMILSAIGTVVGGIYGGPGGAAAGGQAGSAIGAS